MITAIWLKDKLTTKQFKAVDKYIDNIYEKFIKQEITPMKLVYMLLQMVVLHICYASPTIKK